MIPAPSPGAPFYLEPRDLVHTPGAATRTRGVPVLGGQAAALSIALWQPTATADKRLIMHAAALPGWRATLDAQAQCRVDRILAHWRATPAFPGLPRDRAAWPALVGVVNATGDSFYPASRTPDCQAALARAQALGAAGAAILDVGGQSTRPGSLPRPVTAELSATLPVVRALAATGARVSIDTVRPAVARAAVAAGALIVNDVTGLMPADALGSQASIILGHARGNPRTMQRWPRSPGGIFALYDWFERRIAAMRHAGIPHSRIAIDPGFGFGKAIHHNQAIIRCLPLLSGLGVAIALGVSRKASLGMVSGAATADERLPASLAAGLAAMLGGVALLRVHDVDATRQALQTARLCV